MVVGTADIAVTVFCLAISLGLYGFPLVMDLVGKPIFNNNIINLLARRCFFILGTYSVILNITVIMAIIDAATLTNVRPVLDLYLWLFGSLGWLMILYLVVRTLYDSILLWTENKRNKSYEV